MTFISSRKWICRSLDVRAAFLQGFPIEREIFLRPPRDIEEKGYIWKLLKCPYGLNDAPRAWYVRVCSELDQLGIMSSKFDEALFYCRKAGELIGLLVVHVDDILYGGNSKFQDLIRKLCSVFDIGTHSSGNFKYLGLELRQGKDVIHIDQCKYIEGIQEIQVSRCRSRDKDSTLTETERKEMRSVCGQLLWVTNNTRPDMSFEVSTLCNIGKSGTVSDILRVNKVIRVLKQEKIVMKFPRLSDPMSWSLCAFCDSSFANLADGASQGGYVLLLKSCNGKVAPVGWQSKRLLRVTKSTLCQSTQ